MLRRHLVLALAGLAAAASTPAAAQTYPVRPVRIIVPFATGGPADNYARFLAQRLAEPLGQPFVVENRPGAGAVIGTDAVAKAPADGYTLLLMSNAHTVNETLVANKPYQLTRDFVGVAPINYSDLVLVAHPSLKAGGIRELVADAKARPGKLNYASSGTGTPYHMAGELFKSMSGTFLVHIPYKGSSGARTDLLGGQVDMMFDAVTTMVEQVKAGKVKALATTGKQRSEVLPDVPTVHESGVPEYEATIWLGLLAPKGTPRAVVERLNEAVGRIARDPQVRQQWGRQGATPLVMDAAAFDRYIQDDIAKWARVIRAANIKAD
ncbi:tripartite tricarboxylate transporter substrate binding protein [Ramlibacter tataouinensis]|uniref:Candidate extracytoplasmic binding receptor n=1 Tax=Ramlibacter tataouinensis (strain ATCC BAA-407 / DSM 14655 / LMG 21543 / TTB310) TaxID=365046 RepID=F5Y043_RAMTT|nr:tripartite tricarboxylate transporter substrate binding protein [Ramlibacter tataouinensis]AEG94592.1 Candidate extracytoplasmic binding receptor [Ramlibacter tataouinensis TTB310]